MGRKEKTPGSNRIPIKHYFFKTTTNFNVRNYVFMFNIGEYARTNLVTLSIRNLGRAKSKCFLNIPDNSGMI